MGNTVLLHQAREKAGRELCSLDLAFRISE